MLLWRKRRVWITALNWINQSLISILIFWGHHLDIIQCLKVVVLFGSSETEQRFLHLCVNWKELMCHQKYIFSQYNSWPIHPCSVVYGCVLCIDIGFPGMSWLVSVVFFSFFFFSLCLNFLFYQSQLFFGLLIYFFYFLILYYIFPQLPSNLLACFFR